ncbi:hypothetical protein OHD62_12120 [Mesorhizobium sp. YC-39]|uniref:hypothetical protein n=1 Tax=unclassified Mesorhizobium TaxID=325217 RepID=UPI0021E77A22|nr:MULTISPECIES: hypothetical protein [unclassified Mesorhizobium]MCV3207386.1 hypothetical protein [Mesorhizobium sp. YC-2]MCV3229113.1 hypothetical protein [Mesorhizobium sp. YC-39]
MPNSVPPRTSNALHRFVVGRDGEGHWIARDEQGQTGGVFTDRISAIRFATMESDHQAGAVRFAPASARLSLFN